MEGPEYPKGQVKDITIYEIRSILNGVAKFLNEIIGPAKLAVKEVVI